MERALLIPASSHSRHPHAPRRGEATPWGAAETATPIADGIVSVSTASHGGIWISEARRQAMPAAFRIEGHWYEEDCEWALVAASFPDAFRAKYGPSTVESAERTIKNLWPERWEQFTGEPLSPEQSAKRVKIATIEAHRDHRFITCAFGDWHAAVPKGMVGITTVNADTMLAWERGDTHRSGAFESTYAIIPIDAYEASRSREMGVPVDAMEPWCSAPQGAPYSLDPLKTTTPPREAALHHAKAGDWQAAAGALDADRSALATCGPIALWLAVRAGDPHGVRTLLDVGVDPKAWPLPAMAAIHAGRKDLLALLKAPPAPGPALRL